MKTIKILAIAGLAAFVAACGGPEGEKAKTADATEVVQNTGKELSIDTANSTINWTGSKVAGDHTGTIDISEGSIKVANGEIVGGTVTIDMNTISNDDQEGEWKAKLEGHLKSADFFHVDSFPTASFQITSVAPLEGNPAANKSITGNLTMKNITKSITFDALVKVTDTEVKMAAPNFIIDRTEWNVQYGSAKIFDIVKDKAISDDMAIGFDVVAK